MTEMPISALKNLSIGFIQILIPRNSSGETELLIPVRFRGETNVLLRTLPELLNDIFWADYFLIEFFESKSDIKESGLVYEEGTSEKVYPPFRFLPVSKIMAIIEQNQKVSQLLKAYKQADADLEKMTFVSDTID